MYLDLESLRCFVAAAQHLNFRAASRSVGLSPAAFGERIKGLEQELGAELFARTTRSVSLTGAGELLRPQARRCLEEAARCAEVVRDRRAGLAHTLVVGTRYELGMSWIVPSLAALESARPLRRIDLYFGDTPELLPKLRHDEVDCLVTSYRLVASGFAYLPLHEERYVFVAQRGLARRRPLARATDAACHRLLDVHPDLPLFRYFLDGRDAEEDWSFESVQHLGTIGAIRARVLEGAGVAVLPLYFVGKDVERGRLVRLMPRTRLQRDWFRLIWRDGHPREPQIREFGGELSRLPLR